MDNRWMDFVNEAQNFSHPFLVLEGTFGVGKSHSINQLINFLIQNDENAIILYFDLFGCHQFHQISNFLKVFSKLEGLSQIYSELDFFLSKFKDVFSKLNDRNSNLARKILDSYRLRDYFETQFLGDKPFTSLLNYQDEIKEIFSKNIDKRVLLKLFDAISEAIIFSIFNVYHQNKLSGKIKFYLIFDNYELGAGVIDHWITNHLYKYLENLSFGEYENYEPIEIWKDKKAKLLFEYKIILSTRYNFTFEKLVSQITTNKIKRIFLEPLNKENLSSFIPESTSKLNSNEIYLLTFGIPLAISFILDKNPEGIDKFDKSSYFKFIANRIFDRINPKLKETIKLISVFNFFSEETIRCLKENYPLHNVIFNYFYQNKELTINSREAKDALELAQHYKFFISNFLENIEKEKFQNFATICNTFETNFEPLKNLPLIERKALRNLAYFDEFDLGQTLKEIFQDDYSTIEKFVKEHLEFFNQNNGIFSMKNELKQKLTEFNKIVDNIRYNFKIGLIKEVSEKVKENYNTKIASLKKEKEKNNERIQKYQIIKSKIKGEIQEIQKNIVSTENYLIDLNSKKYSTSRKHMWLPFSLLAVAAIVVFLIGNNILYIFSESINIESIKGLGTTLKIFSILLFGIFLFLLIDLLSSKERKEVLSRLEEFVQKEEEKLLELKECLSEFKIALKEIELEINELLKENEILEKELAWMEQVLLINYVNTT